MHGAQVGVQAARAQLVARATRDRAQRGPRGEGLRAYATARGRWAMERRCSCTTLSGCRPWGLRGAQVGPTRIQTHSAPQAEQGRRWRGGVAQQAATRADARRYSRETSACRSPVHRRHHRRAQARRRSRCTTHRRAPRPSKPGVRRTVPVCRDLHAQPPGGVQLRVPSGCDRVDKASLYSVVRAAVVMVCSCVAGRRAPGCTTGAGLHGCVRKLRAAGRHVNAQLVGVVSW